MKKKILAFGASNSRNSINQKFAKYAASQIEDGEINEIDLNDYEMPIFSVDREEKDGIPKLAHDFLKRIMDSDAIIISFAEHNGNYSVAFKNISDWVSRIELKTWQHKPTLLLASSPGPRGGKSVIGLAQNDFPRRGANVMGSFSLPKFYDNFSESDGILNDELKQEFNEKLDPFKLKL